MTNPATEFIKQLVYPGEEQFSPKHLAQFAVETLSDPYIKIKDLSLMMAYILPLIADQANWPGQRERIRRRFAEAIGRIPAVKFEYRLRENFGKRPELERLAGEEAEALIRECRKLNDDEFIRAAIRFIKRHQPCARAGKKYNSARMRSNETDNL